MKRWVIRQAEGGHTFVSILQLGVQRGASIGRVPNVLKSIKFGSWVLNYLFIYLFFINHAFWPKKILIIYGNFGNKYIYYIYIYIYIYIEASLVSSMDPKPLT
jgi:hypothetical protein